MDYILREGDVVLVTRADGKYRICIEQTCISVERINEVCSGVVIIMDSENKEDSGVAVVGFENAMIVGSTGVAVESSDVVEVVECDAVAVEYCGDVVIEGCETLAFQ